MSPTPSDLLIHCLREALNARDVIETHISWVLLTGETAYKLKKPVDLGFVDFTTLERRRRFCEEELRLNRRLAPEIYLDVTAITGTPDAPVLGGEGAAIEYAVVMRQFAQEALLSRVLDRGELLPEHIDRLAAEIAGFHARADVAGDDSPFGTPECVLAPVEENFRHLHAVGTGAQPGRAEQLARLRAWSEREFAARRDVFAERRGGGCVREGHGDMHLGNMILTGDDVTIFDCIEFNDSFRWIDVISDVAFTVMDLADRGRPDFAHRLLNGYLETTGDYAGLRVLPFYLTYRALVRAKVAGLRLDQPGLAASERSRQQQKLDGYLELAESCTAPRRPFMAITHGVSGSGKTWGTQGLVEELGAVRIRSDVERKRLSGLRPLDRVEAARLSALYSSEMGRRTYMRLAELAETIVGAGFPVVVDATFLQRSGRREFQELAGRAGVSFLILDFRAPDSVLIERVSLRSREGADASDADVSVLREQLRSREPLSIDELPQTIAVDTTDAECGARLLADVRRRVSA